VRNFLNFALLACLLVAWAAAVTPANVTLAPYGNPPIGYAFTISGCVLIASRLLRNPAGNPADYYWIPYPIHAGLVALSIGISMIFHSAPGLWLVTPFLAAACATTASVQPDAAKPRLLPPDNDARPTTRDGIRFLFIVVIPWLAIFEFTSHMRLHGAAFRFPFEDHLPVYAWTALIYETSYLTVTFAPTWTRTNRQLRQLMITSWVAMLIVYPIYWFIPSAAPRRPMIDDSWIAHLLVRERTGVAPTAAFPSFHVLWAIFVGRLWPRWIWFGYTSVIAVSCISTGMHYIPDVLAAIAISPLLLEPNRLKFIRTAHPERLAIMIFLSLLLLRLWISGCPLTLITGVFALGVSILLMLDNRRRSAAVAALIGAILTTLPGQTILPKLAWLFRCVSQATESS